MAQKGYTHKTTKEQFKRFKTQSRNDAQVLHSVFINETGNNIPYPVFLAKLDVWLRKTKRSHLNEGVPIINKYLSDLFA